MVDALPLRRRHKLLANIFAAAKNLEKSEKRLAPDLENAKSGVFILNPARPEAVRSGCAMKGGDAMT